MKPRILILRSAGTNCEVETAHAFELAGGDPRAIHINRLLESPDLLNEFELMAIPGGFSYGDDIAAGKILANQLMQHLSELLHHFVDQGKPIIGICNGFQVLVKTDLLPGPLAGERGQTCTLTNNDSGRFIDRWIHLERRFNKCIWTKDLAALELPIAHGEGKFIPGSDAIRKALWDNEQVALVYTAPADAASDNTEQANPNGSTDAIAGVCDATGLIFGLMPHPERHVDPTQHPAWTSHRPLPEEGQGLAVFRNAIRYVEQV